MGEMVGNIVTIVTSIGSMVAVIATIIQSNKLVAYRIEQLEEKVIDISKLNNRMAIVETKLTNLEKDMKG